MLISFLAFAATGAFAGLLAGLLGIGGGMIIVPALIFLLPAFGVDASVLSQVAVGSSLACISIISLNSATAHARRKAVDWHVLLRMLPGLMLGGVIGAWLANLLPSESLQRLVGVAALLIAARMFTNASPGARRKLPATTGLSAAGGAIGTLSSLIGIGGGSLTVPFLNWCNVPMQRAVGTSSACGVPIAWVGAASFIFTGWGLSGTGEQSLGYVNYAAAGGVILGSLAFTPMGAALAHRLPASALRRVFAVLLVIVGLRMLLF